MFFGKRIFVSMENVTAPKGWQMVEQDGQVYLSKETERYNRNDHELEKFSHILV